MLIATRTGAVTPRPATPAVLVAASVAVMTVAPIPTPVASPRDPFALEMLATVVSDDDQTTWVVRS